MTIFDNVISVDIDVISVDISVISDVMRVIRVDSVINVMLVISFDISVTNTDMNMVAAHVPSVVMVITSNVMPLLLTLL